MTVTTLKVGNTGRMNAPFADGSPVPCPRTGGAGLALTPSLERRRVECYLGLITTDVLALFAGFALAGYLQFGRIGLVEASPLARVVLPVFLTIALYNGSYSIDALRRPLVGIIRAETALLISTMAVVFIAFYAGAAASFSRLGLTLGVLCAGHVLLWARLQMRGFVAWRCGPSVINELVIDDGGPKVDLPNSIRISADALGLEPKLDDPNALDRVGIALRNIDRVVVTCPRERRAAWALMLKGANVEGEVLDDEVVRLGAQGARVVNGHGMLLVSAGPLGIRARAVKRLFDIAIAGTALLVLAPLFVVVAIAIKLEDGGPVFFVQRRMGRGNCFFNIYKFRSMTFAEADRDGIVSASRDDRRITRFGRFIRSTSIDELPQLINVLKGDMSIVGPRPHAIGSQAGTKLFWEVDLRYWQRHSLKPGLSGLAQVRGFRGATESESDLVDRLQSDLEYLEGWTILRDVRIILLTLRVIVHDRAF